MILMQRQGKSRILAIFTALILALMFAMPTAEITYADANVTVPVKVSFSGSGMPEETFTVQMQSEDGGESFTAQTTLSAGKNDDSVDIDLGNLSAGLHRYELREVKGSNPDITYSNRVYTYYVYVHDDGTVDQRAVNKEDDADKPDMVWFANSYRDRDRDGDGDGDRDPDDPDRPETVIGDPPVRIKKDISLKKPEKPDRFVFVMKPEKPDYPLPDVVAAKSGVIKDGVAEVYLRGEGEIEIGNITFNREGTYRYFVSEKDTAIEGYNYDDARFTVVYEVTRDQDGKLTCERTITKKDGGVVYDCEFDNIYHPNPVVRKLSRAVKTGDPLVMWPVTGLFVGLIGLIAVAIDRRNRREARRGRG